MGTSDEAAQAILDRIAELAPQTRYAAALRDYAEAVAWIKYPNQAHGGHSTAKA